MREFWQCPHCGKSYDYLVEAQSCGCNYLEPEPMYECDLCGETYDDPGEARECEREDKDVHDKG